MGKYSDRYKKESSSTTTSTKSDKHAPKLLPLSAGKQRRDIAATSAIEKLQEPSAAKTASSYYTPVLEGLGAGVGAVVGSAEPGAGTVIGGGLGYGIGKRTASAIDQWLGLKEPQTVQEAVYESTQDVLTGMTYEMGGQVAAKVAPPLIKTAQRLAESVPGVTAIKSSILRPITKRAAEKEIGMSFIAQTDRGPLIADSLDEAARLENEIPGLKFTHAQATGDKTITRLQNMQARMSGEFAEDLGLLEAKNSEAMRKYIASSQGTESIDDTARKIISIRDGIEADIRTGSTAMETEIAKLETGYSPEEAGEVIKSAIKSNRSGVKANLNEMFDEIPNVPVRTGNLITELIEVQKPKTIFETPENMSGDIDRVIGILKQKKSRLKLKELQGLRSELKSKLRDARKGGNDSITSRLAQSVSAVEKLLGMSGAIEDQMAAQMLKKATTAYKKEYIDVFKNGTVRDILKVGEGAIDRVQGAKIAEKFFQPGMSGTRAAEEFLTATNKDEKALKAITDYASAKLAQSVDPVTGEISRKGYLGFLKKYGPALKAYGIEGEFGSLGQAISKVQVRRQLLDNFNKSEASRLLQGEPGREIMSALSKGSKSTSMKNLMGAIGDNKAALEGTRSAFVDEIIDTAEIAGVDKLGNPVISLTKLSNNMKKYRPALRELYKHEPSKLKALDNIQAAMTKMQTSKEVSRVQGTQLEKFMQYMLRSPRTKKGAVLRLALKPLYDLSQTNLNAVLNRALIDPEYAYTIMNIARGYKVPVMVERMRGHMASMGLRETDRAMEE